jgi:hypothetical protein
MKDERIKKLQFRYRDWFFSSGLLQLPSSHLNWKNRVSFVEKLKNKWVLYNDSIKRLYKFYPFCN